MSNSADVSMSNDPHFDPQLMWAVDEISARIQLGKSVDIESYVKKFPDRAAYVRQLVQTLEGLSALGTTAAQSADDAVQPETRQIGDFRIVRELGRGGMGAVFEAEQISMGRHVALKVLPFAALAHDKALQRFRNEVRAAAALDHPHIVSVYSVGEERGIHYYSMQLVRGQTMAELIWQTQNELSSLASPELSDAVSDVGAELPGYEGEAVDSLHARSLSTQQDEQARLSTAIDSRRDTRRYRTAARLGVQAAAALQHAHDQGVLHRDIKPGNLMLDAGGELHITDFGLARIEADAGMTMTGDIVGTLRYMAPEQALAKRVVIDHRADIYSLGATLYELLTLQAAFGGTDRSELLKQIAFTEPTPLRKLDRHMPVELETIVLTAMAKNADERYQTAHLLAEDLQRFLDNQPIRAKPPSLFQLLAKWSQRHAAAVWAILVTLLAISVVLSISQFVVSRANRKLAAGLHREEVAVVEAQTSADAARLSANVAQLAERRSGDLLFAADVRLASEALANNNVSEARERLARHVPAEGDRDRRGFAWQYLWSQLQQEEMALTGHGTAFDVEYSPDGSLLASSHESGDVVLYRAATGEEQHVLTGARSTVRRLDFSTDGKLVAGASDDGHVCVWDTQRGALNLSFAAHRDETDDVAFHPTKRQLATAGDGVVRLYQLPATDFEQRAEPTVVATLSDLPGKVLSVAIDSQGRWLAAAGEIDEETDNMWGYVILWDMETGSTVHTFRLARKVYRVCFSDSAELLAAGTQSGQIAVWNIENFQQLANWSFHSSWVNDLDFAPDGEWLVSASKDSTACLWKLDRPEPARVLKGHSRRVHGVAVSPQTGQIATASGDGAVKIWQPLVDSFSMQPLGHGSFASFIDDGSSVVVSAYAGFAVRHDLVERTKYVLPSIQFGGVTTAVQSKQNRFILPGRIDYSTEIHSANSGAPQEAAVVVCDFDGDGDDDRVTALGRTHHIVWQENTGEGTFGNPQLSKAPGVGNARCVVEDCNDDSLKDVLEVRARAGLLTLNPHEWHKRLQHIQLVSELAYPVALCANDLDQDDDLDVVIATHGDDSISWFEQTGTTRDGVPEFKNRHVLTTELKEAAAVVAADVTGDGRPEIVAAGFDDDQILLFENLGSGRFADARVLPKRIIGPKVLEIADVDRDGHADVLVATDEQTTWFPNRGDGSFPIAASIDSLEAGPWIGPLPANVIVYNARTNKVEHRVKTCSSYARKATLAPDGLHLAVVDSQSFIRIWELPSERLIETIPPSGVQANDLVYTPNGRYLLAAVGDDLRIWSTPGYKLVGDLKEHDNTINRIAVSADSRRAATVSDDLSVRVWSLAQDRPVQVLLGHKSYVSAVAFSPDGRRLATADRDGNVRIWDLVTAQELLVLRDATVIKNQSRPIIQDLIFHNDRTLAAAVSDRKQGRLLLAEWQADTVTSGTREIPVKSHAEIHAGDFANALVPAN